MDGVVITVLLALWNLLITIVIGLTAVVHRQYKDRMKEQGDELARITILINKTREEIARETATKAEVERVTDHIDQRFNRLETKIDQLIESHRRVL
jgi:hypothetical protein